MDEREKAIREELALHTKPAYMRQDIMRLEGCSQQVATRLMKTLREEYGGAILKRPYAVRADAYYRYCGWDYVEYLKEFLNVKGNQI